jgi:hypothetical protein
LARPSEKTIKRLYAVSGNLCAFPRCSVPLVESIGTITGEICHIRAQNEGGPRFDRVQTDEQRNEFANLVLLCRRHHKMVDSEPDVYSVEALEEIKSIREKEMGRPEQTTDSFYAKILLNDLPRIEINNNSGNFVINSPNTILAKTVIVRTARKTIKILPPAGTIGADQDASRYIQHLIKQYNKFASADKTRGAKFHFGVISKNIEDNFRAPWKMLVIDDFRGLCEYLQRRINVTRIGKLNAAKREKNFSSFEEYSRAAER